MTSKEQGSDIIVFGGGDRMHECVAVRVEVEQSQSQSQMFNININMSRDFIQIFPISRSFCTDEVLLKKWRVKKVSQ
jgi:hypothetical protein